MTVNANPPILRVLGSLWLAAVLLVLILVAMACATVYESEHGTEQALVVFYKSWWFEGLLALLAVNVLLAMALRWPFTRRQAGFVLTHVSIFAVLGGALVTKWLGVDGRLAIAEGQSVGEITQANSPTLTILNQENRTQASVDLDPSVFAGFSAAESPRTPPLVLGSLRVEVARYLPDSEESQQVVEDPARGQPAIEVALAHSGPDQRDWVFAGASGIVGSIPVAFITVASAEAVDRMLNAAPADESASKGSVRLEYQGQAFAFPIERCQDAPVPLGETGLTVRVLRYLPHATVGPERDIVNASSQPVNPYIEVEVAGPSGTEKRRAFAKFPEFDSMHGAAGGHEIALTFQAADSVAPTSPIEVIGGPDGRLHVRFSEGGKILLAKEAALGSTVETPWAPMQFTILRQVSKGRRESTIAAVAPVRKTGRVPAVLLRLKSDGPPTELWVQDGRPRMTMAGTVDCRIDFGEKLIPLGFQLALDKFRLGTYPGSRKPRSYESRITINDPHAGGEISRVISMNHPTEYGGYTFYQSSYSQNGDQAVSVLSVSRDPGQPIVFAGYVGLLVGMIWVLVLRMKDRKAEVPHAVLQPDV